MQTVTNVTQEDILLPDGKSESAVCILHFAF